MEIDKTIMHKAYKMALQGLENMIYMRNLMKVHPIVRCEINENTKMYNVLKRTGSPACTDGEKIYYSEEVTRDLFSKVKLYYYKRPDRYLDSEEEWNIEPDEESEVKSLDAYQLSREISTILYHEMNHAMYEHLKDEIIFKNKSEKFKGKMRIAHEIQANDGFCGTGFALMLTQQIKGVTNKRQYKTTIGFHKLKDIIEHLPDDAGENGEGQGKSSQQQMAEETGAYERVKEKAEQESNKESNEKIKEPGEQFGNKSSDQIAKEIYEKVRQENFKFGKNKLRGVIVSALSDRLMYDTDSERVMVSKSYKKIKVRTYSRPSKKQIIVME